MNRSFLNVFCAVAVLAAVILTLAACGGDKTGQTTAAFDAEKAFSRLLSEVKYAETLADTSSSADFMFSDLPQNAEIKMYTCESGSHPDELIMMKAAKAEDVQALETAAKTHLTELTAQLRDYNPQEVPRVENAVVCTNGLYVFVCVTDDVETAKAILK